MLMKSLFPLPNGADEVCVQRTEITPDRDGGDPRWRCSPSRFSLWSLSAQDTTPSGRQKHLTRDVVSHIDEIPRSSFWRPQISHSRRRVAHHIFGVMPDTPRIALVRWRLRELTSPRRTRPHPLRGPRRWTVGTASDASRTDAVRTP